MQIWKHYHQPKTVQAALRHLRDASGPSSVIAGGTDLLLDLQQGRHSPVHTLVDVTTIPEMNVLEIRQGRLFIGAAIPLNHILGSPLVQEHAHALIQAVSLIGGPQVRNIATLGGNVAHALPAGDGTIALMALDASADIASLEGIKTAPLAELFLGPGRSTLSEKVEIVVGFNLPLLGECQASAFKRVMRPQGVAIAILNMSVWMQLDGGMVTSVRLAVGPAGPVPFRAKNTESLLAGKQLNFETIAEAARVLLGEARFRSSPHRASAEYRRKMAGVLLYQVLLEAARRIERT